MSRAELELWARLNYELQCASMARKALSPVVRMTSPTESKSPCRRGAILAPNMGVWDRLLRLIVSLGLLYAIFYSPWLAGDWVLQVLGVGFAFLNLFAVSTQWCPMYCFTGTDTRGAIARGGV
jgi:hypothetical protein